MRRRKADPQAGKRTGTGRDHQSRQVAQGQAAFRHDFAYHGQQPFRLPPGLRLGTFVRAAGCQQRDSALLRRGIEGKYG